MVASKQERVLVGNYNKTNYAYLIITAYSNQVVIRQIGSTTHLSIHRLPILSETRKTFTVKYQNSNLKLFKKTYTSLSYDWYTPNITSVWSDAKVEVAKKLNFSRAIYHGYMNQGLIMKDKENGWEIGGILIKLNERMTSRKYLKMDKIQVSEFPINKFFATFRVSDQAIQSSASDNIMIENDICGITISISITVNPEIARAKTRAFSTARRAGAPACAGRPSSRNQRTRQRRVTVPVRSSQSEVGAQQNEIRHFL